MSTSYEHYVKMGKSLLEEVQSKQALVAFYATQVCEIKRGGGSEKRYTITQYAKDIGMNPMLLTKWVLVYNKVIVKVGIEAQNVTKKDWAVASSVDKFIKSENILKNILSGSKSKKLKCKPLSIKKTKDLFNQNYDGPSFQAQIYTYNSYLITVKNNLISKDLSLASLSSLAALKENLDKASDAILNHLTKGNKRSVVIVKKSDKTNSRMKK
jgi:hypothetical protein